MEEEGLGGGARLVISDLHTDCDLDTRASGLARVLLHKAVGASEQ